MAAETEVCGICLETVHRWGDGVTWLTCCGKVMHVACGEELRTSAHGDKCPMCRAPVPTTYLESHRRALKWAERGKGWAMYIVGQHYGDGQGVPVSMEQARVWYGRAAEQGDADALFYFGLLPEKGQGVVLFIEAALVW